MDADARPRSTTTAKAQERSLRDLRAVEVELLRAWLRPGFRVLEIGGGNGFQAALIASWGYSVESIDITPAGQDGACRYYPVTWYDGENVPHRDNAFDVVFSSNVLEHVRRLPALLAETKRVLSPDGLSMHIVPSASWRLWTSGAHYLHLVRRAFCRRGRVGDDVGRYGGGGARPARSLLALLARALFDRPHGEFPTAAHELVCYRRRRWARVFAEHGFTVVRVTGNGLFYTGCQLLPDMRMPLRRWLASVLGSACHVFVLKHARRDEAGTPGTGPSSL